MGRLKKILFCLVLVLVFVFLVPNSGYGIYSASAIAGEVPYIGVYSAQPDSFLIRGSASRNFLQLGKEYAPEARAYRCQFRTNGKHAPHFHFYVVEDIKITVYCYRIPEGKRLPHITAMYCGWFTNGYKELFLDDKKFYKVEVKND